MRIAQLPECHLTYCTNIHQGETWDDVWHQWQKYLPEVKSIVSPIEPFGVGARLSALAASELLQDDNLNVLKCWLADSDLYIFSLNGFPYGRFHKGTIKENVYLPDWSSQTRVDYTMQLAEILAELLPLDCVGTISTVPIGLKTTFRDKEKLFAAIDNLERMALFLKTLRKKTGRHIQLALEPEPGCYLEKSSDIISFFSQHIFSQPNDWVINSVQNSPLNIKHDEIGDYIGICLDTCHTSVMNEKSADVFKALSASGIGIFKVQLTAALHIPEVDQEILESLTQLADSAYLHQTSVIDQEGKHSFYIDLPEALANTVTGDTLRIHYHVPVFRKIIGALQTTRDDLIQFLDTFTRTPVCQHLEVETYTFDIIPDKYIENTATDNIITELQWVLDTISLCSQEQL